MSVPFSEFIKIIGKGKKGSRSLTREEAFTAMKMVLKQKVTGEQRGAFLMLLRTREETPDEICGFLDACRALENQAVKALPATLDIGCYAGKRRQLPWYLLAVACLAKEGIPIFLHGAQEPGSGRLYASHVLPQLGLTPVGNVAQAANQLQSHCATYLDLGLVLPALNDIIKLREVFGLRSCANTLGRLLNPSAAPYSVQGVFHTHLDDKHGQVNQAFEHYDALCFRGDGGDPEVNSERETTLFITRAQNTAEVTLPMTENGWAMKDKTMNVDDMLRYWQGDITHKYAEHSVLPSLISYLMLINQLDYTQAAAKANSMWQNRDKTQLPFGGKA
ncbi:glycosyl transferase family protein [Alteromonas lipotrueiana]|uniref:glycosyl transferase family protein n=1 Tax=Alteromonas lipotrueiana TaxID=2803815 RepID=UPI001C4539F1|nr:glycosyl transferase family protein [Alteromonas lipotrueiana]